MTRYENNPQWRAIIQSCVNPISYPSSINIPPFERIGRPEERVDPLEMINGSICRQIEESLRPYVEASSTLEYSVFSDQLKFKPISADNVGQKIEDFVKPKCSAALGLVNGAPTFNFIQVVFYEGLPFFQTYWPGYAWLANVCASTSYSQGGGTTTVVRNHKNEETLEQGYRQGLVEFVTHLYLRGKY